MKNILLTDQKSQNVYEKELINREKSENSQGRNTILRNIK